MSTYVPAIVSAITNANWPPSKEGKGKEFRTARFILRDAIKPVWGVGWAERVMWEWERVGGEGERVIVGEWGEGVWMRVNVK